MNTNEHEKIVRKIAKVAGFGPMGRGDGISGLDDDILPKLIDFYLLATGRLCVDTYLTPYDKMCAQREIDGTNGVVRKGTQLTKKELLELFLPGLNKLHGLKND
tara:strand:+ start:850 stop:1161 length:312 start_codon:yes stop_codon:yes gene_type:complete